MPRQPINQRSLGRSDVAYHKRREKKQAGAFFTPERLADWIARNLVEETAVAHSRGFSQETLTGASQYFQRLLNIKICDPAMGDGVFLARAGHHLKRTLRNFLKSLTETQRNTLDVPSDLGAWIVENNLYGVDQDPRAVYEARQRLRNTLLSNPRVVSEGAIASHLVQGNALLDPLGPLLVNEKEELGDALNDVLDRNPLECSSLPEELQTLLMKSGKITTSVDGFSWILSFPEVFASANGHGCGFDIVLGNPPWEVIRPNDMEFFDQIEPGFSKLSKDEREAKKESLLEDLDIRQEYEEYREEINELKNAAKNSPLFQNERSARGSLPGAWSYNTFRLFVELSTRLVRPRGFFSFLIPSSFMGELGSTGLRRMFLKDHELEWIAAFHPNNQPFGEVDHPFCTFKLQTGSSTEEFKCIHGLTSLEELENALEDTPSISTHLIERMSPETVSFTPVQKQIELSILEKLGQFPALGEEIDGVWNATPSRDLDETKDRHLLTEEETCYRFLKGRAVFPLRIEHDRVGYYLKEDLYRPRDEHSRTSRVVWRDVTRPSMARRMYATVCPQGYGVGNSLNYIIPTQSETEKVFLAAVMCSMVFEYRARQLSRNSHMNMFIIRQMPVPRLTEGDSMFDDIVSDASQILNNESVKSDKHVGTRARIDALVAHMYGLDREEMRFIVDSYTKVDAEYRNLVMDEFLKVEEGM